MAKGKIIAPKAVKREKGKMYFIDGSGNVRETKMNRKGGKKGRHVCRVEKPKTSRPKAKAKTKKRRR
jgi:hypothetical protein